MDFITNPCVECKCDFISAVDSSRCFSCERKLEKEIERLKDKQCPCYEYDCDCGCIKHCRAAATQVEAETKIRGLLKELCEVIMPGNDGRDTKILEWCNEDLVARIHEELGNE
jgi:hypothetical protein